jgi:hypothetical protein
MSAVLQVFQPEGALSAIGHLMKGSRRQCLARAGASCAPEKEISGRRQEAGHIALRTRP